MSGSVLGHQTIIQIRVYNRSYRKCLVQARDVAWLIPNGSRRSLTGRMNVMLFRKIAALGAALVALSFSNALHAQLGLYATVTGGRAGGITCLDPQHVCASNDGAIRPYGTTFGGYYEFRNYGPARVGFDVRGSVLNTNKPADLYQASTDNIRHYTALGGLRASFATPFKYIRPYAQVHGGLARSNMVGEYHTVAAGLSPFNPALDYRNYGQVQGVDVPLFSIIELRAIEFTDGEMFGPSTHNVATLSAGIVFHLSR